MRRTVIWIGLLSGICNGHARADGLLHRLPDDGAWVRYRVVILDRDGELTGNMVLRSVGRTSIDGRECRWIEFHFETDRMNGIMKLLIPENYLQAGQNPLDHVIRGWQKLGDRATRKIEDPAELGILPYLLTPPLTDSTQADTMSTLDWPYGRLQCSVQLGCLFRNQIAADGRRKMEKVCYEVGLHDQIPFGAASARLEINIDRDGEWERVKAVSIVAADCGKDARSQLPEYQ